MLDKKPEYAVATHAGVLSIILARSNFPGRAFFQNVF